MNTSSASRRTTRLTGAALILIVGLGLAGCQTPAPDTAAPKPTAHHWATVPQAPAGVDTNRAADRVAEEIERNADRMAELSSGSRGFPQDQSRSSSSGRPPWGRSDGRDPAIPSARAASSAQKLLAARAARRARPGPMVSRKRRAASRTSGSAARSGGTRAGLRLVVFAHSLRSACRDIASEASPPTSCIVTQSAGVSEYGLGLHASFLSSSLVRVAST